MSAAPAPAETLNRTTSVYLDLVRLAAALVVVATHLAYPRFTGGRLIALRTYGNDAVMVFFVLSGFVIAYTAATRERDLRTYAVHRLARLWSVAVPAIFLTFAFDEIGRRIDPALYAGFQYQASDPLGRVFAALTFTNELWFRSVRIFSNGPYWSLGYEFWYYVIFGAAWYLGGRARTVALVAIGLVVGPKILLLFPIWLLGVWVYRTSRRRRLGPAAGALLFGGSIALYATLRALGVRDLLLDATYALFGRSFVRGELMWSDEFLFAQVIGVLVAANFLGFEAIADRAAPLLRRNERWIRDWAGFTFSIYLFHYPLLQLFGALSPLPPSSVLAGPVLFVATILACRALGTFTEKRKDLARDWIRRVLPAT